MTDKQIVRALAEKVMGGIPLFGTGHPLSPADPQRDRDGVFSYWNPLKSDTDACAVLDKMAERRGFELMWCHDLKVWWMNVSERDGQTIRDCREHGKVEPTYHEDRKRTICIAALKAVGAWEKGENE